VQPPIHKSSPSTSPISFSLAQRPCERNLFFSFGNAVPQQKKRQLKPQRHMLLFTRAKTKTKRVKCSFCFAVCPFHLFAFEQNSHITPPSMLRWCWSLSRPLSLCPSYFRPTCDSASWLSHSKNMGLFSTLEKSYSEVTISDYFVHMYIFCCIEKLVDMYMVKSTLFLSVFLALSFFKSFMDWI